MTSLFDQAFTTSKTTIPLNLITSKQLQKIKSDWIKATDFKAEQGQICILPHKTGKVQEVLVGSQEFDSWALAHLPSQLPKGNYKLKSPFKGEKLHSLLIGWALAFYTFDHHKKEPVPRPQAKLIFPDEADRKYVRTVIESITTIRDLINMPANHLSPFALADQAKKIAKMHGADITVIKDQSKLAQDFPLVYAVGKSSTNAPCFIEMRWGKKTHPKLALIGKGVTFDTGGLNLKPGSAMGLMKKDMGGAAHALGVAQAIMALNLPVNLRVYVPSAENAVSGTAMRPQDVLMSRKGLTVEIDNTDAEGRLLLADALTKACEDKADYLIDFSTLTGAARVALGPEIPALFSNTPKWAQELVKRSAEYEEPFWELPLYKGYRKWNTGKSGDLTNSANTPFAGAILAGLFLESFVEPTIPWIHLDLYGWNPTAKPGRPEGGEAFGVRSLLAIIQELCRKNKKLTKS